MRVFVALQPARDKPVGKTVYAMLLPCKGDWQDISVRPSSVEGFGVFPNSGRLPWSALDVPVLIPYLGVESVVEDQQLLNLLLQVLRGEFETLNAEELFEASSQRYVQDGLCAVPLTESKSGRATKPLQPQTELLQVAMRDNKRKTGVREICGGNTSVCYLVSSDVRDLLQLSGKNAHLWELLKAHSRHHHADRHLATHIAHVWREEEGYVLINAHPAFEETLSIAGMINEPTAKSPPNMKMLVGYARLLRNEDSLLRDRGLKQPENVEQIWRECMLPPAQDVDIVPVTAKTDWERVRDPYLSEKMVVYASTRKSYDPGEELTVDYGSAYRRQYHSAHRRPAQTLYDIPKEEISPRLYNAASWPSLPGWWNPGMQPQRAAFRRLKNGIVCVDDDLHIVLKRYQALGIPLTPELVRFVREQGVANATDDSEKSSSKATSILQWKHQNTSILDHFQTGKRRRQSASPRGTDKMQLAAVLPEKVMPSNYGT